jgi:hypothetical protein
MNGVNNGLNGVICNLLPYFWYCVARFLPGQLCRSLTTGPTFRKWGSQTLSMRFWSPPDLNKYINLKNRVEARMALVDIAAEDNILQAHW